MKTVKPWTAAAVALALCAASGVRAAELPAGHPPIGDNSLQPAPMRSAEVSKEAEDAIQQMLQAYAAMKDYQGTLTLTLSHQQGEKKQAIVTKGTVIVQRPDKASVRLSSGDMHYAIACDGKQCMAYFSTTGKYLKWKAPSSLDQTLLNPILLQVMGDTVRVALIPFAENAYKDFMIGVAEAHVVPSEAGKPIHIQLNVTSGVMDFYIDPKSHLVTEAHALPTHMIEAARANNPNLGDLKISSDLTQQAAAPGTPLPADAFSTAPPQGATAALTMMDLVQPPPVKEMVDFTLPSLAEGQKVKLSDNRGKAIMLDFWATWCGPCQAELPMLQEIYKEFKDKGLVFLAVDQGEDKDTVSAYLKAHDLDIPVVLDAEGTAGHAYQVEGLPTLYLIGKDGKVLSHTVGFDQSRRDETKDGLEAAIKAALAAPAPAGGPGG